MPMHLLASMEEHKRMTIWGGRNALQYLPRRPAFARRANPNRIAAGPWCRTGAVGPALPGRLGRGRPASCGGWAEPGRASPEGLDRADRRDLRHPEEQRTGDGEGHSVSIRLD